MLWSKYEFDKVLQLQVDSLIECVNYCKKLCKLKANRTGSHLALMKKQISYMNSYLNENIHSGNTKNKKHFMI